MAASPDWRGAISFAGFNIPVAAYKRIKTRRSESFKTLDREHNQPVRSIYIDIKDKHVERADTLKGVPNGDGWTPLTNEGLELIEAISRSAIVEIARFSPADTIPLELSIETYALVPDPKTPGSEQSMQTLWNGLRATKLAAVIDGWSPHTGSKPSTLAIVATASALTAYVMPFHDEIKADNPVWQPTVDKKAGNTVAQAAEAHYTIEDFDIAVYKDTQAQKRQAAIDMALQAKPMVAKGKKADKPVPPVGDLMAALEKSLAGQTKTKRPRKAAEPTSPRPRKTTKAA